MNTGIGWRVAMAVASAISAATSVATAQPPISGWTPQSEFPPLPPQLEFAPPSNPAEARRQDLAAFRPFLYLNRSYSFERRSEAEARMQALESSVSEMSNLDFQIELHRIAALGDNPHSSIREGGFTRNFGSLPIRGYFFADGYHILRAAPGYEDLLGARVVKVNQRDITDVIAALRALVGGPDAYFRNTQADLLWTAPALLKAYELGRRSDRATLELVLANGETTTRRIKILQPQSDAQFEKGWVNLIPSAMPPDSDWSSLLDEADAPLFVQDWSANFAFSWIDNRNTPYLRLRNLRDSDTTSIEDFLGEAASEIAEGSPRALIVDLRLAFGGGYEETWSFYERIASLMPEDARVYLLVGNATFSAGILSAGALLQVFGERVTIIGEDVGDRERFWAEKISYNLPNSNLRINYSMFLHDIENGCDDAFVCFPGEREADIAVGKLTPDAPLPLLFESYAAGRDPALELAIQRSRGEK